MKNTLIILVILAVMGAAFLLRSPQDKSVPTATREESQKATLKNKVPPLQDTEEEVSISENLRKRVESPEPNLDKRVIRYTDGSVDLTTSITTSSKLHQSPNAQTDLEIVSQILSQYRLIFKQNPVGVENFEFTAALTGENPKKVNFLDPNSPALSENNELVDRWGSPIRFHPISGSKIELLSLGPDKTLWTEDDIKLDFKNL